MEITADNMLLNNDTKNNNKNDNHNGNDDHLKQSQNHQQMNKDQDLIVEKMLNFIGNEDHVVNGDNDHDNNANNNHNNHINNNMETLIKMTNDSNNNDVIDDNYNHHMQITSLINDNNDDNVNDDEHIQNYHQQQQKQVVNDNNFPQQTTNERNNINDNNVIDDKIINRNDDPTTKTSHDTVNNDDDEINTNDRNVENHTVPTVSTNTTVNQSTASNPLDKITHKKSLDYLKELFNDRERLLMMPLGLFKHTLRLLDQEIVRIRTSLIHIDGSIDERKPLQLPEPDNSEIVQRTARISIPIDKYPDHNFVGRIIGPRGLTIQELENDCGCKLYIRGKGSLRNKDKEEKLRGQPNWEHLNEDLHVMIVVEDTPNRIELKLNYAREQIEKLIDSVIQQRDDFKMRQLAELAILNDKFNMKNKLLPTSSPTSLMKNRNLLLANNGQFNSITASPSTPSSSSSSPTPSASAATLNPLTNQLLIETALPTATFNPNNIMLSSQTSPQTLATLLNNSATAAAAANLAQYHSAAAATQLYPPSTLNIQDQSSLLINHNPYQTHQQQQISNFPTPQTTNQQDLFTIMATAAATAATLHGYNQSSSSSSTLPSTGVPSLPSTISPAAAASATASMNGFDPNLLLSYNQYHQRQQQQQQRYHPYHMINNHNNMTKRKHTE